MQTASSCQSCRRSPSEQLLRYQKGNNTVVRNDGFLQCDICERYACADCLKVYDIFSGYDFLCHECARGFEPPPPGTRGH
jgi:hypothetical protein